MTRTAIHKLSHRPAAVLASRTGLVGWMVLGCLACSAYDAELLAAPSATERGTVRSSPDAGRGDAGIGEPGAPADASGSDPEPADAGEPFEAGGAPDAGEPLDAAVATIDAAAPVDAAVAIDAASRPSPSVRCNADSECAAGSYCALQTGDCVRNDPDGARCERDGECRSGRCQAERCCADGDECCRTAADCPASFAMPPACEDEGRCQGSRVEAVCDDSVCGSAAADDDSACGVEVRALACGVYPDVRCSGELDQAPPTECATGCDTDSECTEGARCLDGSCTETRADGESCENDRECSSAHCENRVCCDQGRCCARDDDCEDVYLCTNPRACQGVVFRVRCSADARCERASEPQFNSLGCAGQRARTCASGNDVRCPLLSFAFVPECGATCFGDDCGGFPGCEGDECEWRWR
jgi:hypothetical protein